MHPAPWFAGLTLALVVLPSAAPASEAPKDGQSAASCKALSAQIKDLTKRQAKAQQKRERGNGGGLFASLNRVAMPVLDSVVSQTGGATMAAADGARQGLRATEEAEATGGSAPPADTSGIDAQLNRLVEQRTTMGCPA